MTEQQITNRTIARLPQNDAPINEFTTSTGVRFRVKPVPPLLVREAPRRIARPTPPLVANYDKDPDGHVVEENPNDPGYLRAIDDYNQEVGDLVNAILLTRGAELLSVPANIDKPEDIEWAEDLINFAGIEVPKSGRGRYFAWLKFVALASMDDFVGLIGKISTAAGMTREGDVAEALDSFRPEEAGNTSNGVRPEEAAGRGVGDSPPAAGVGA